MMFHVLHRAAGHRTLFDEERGFLAIENVLEEPLPTGGGQRHGEAVSK